MSKSGVKNLSTVLVVCLMLVLFSVSFASANWFTDIFAKITGKSITGNVIAGPSEGLVAYFPFDSDINDYSDFGRAGTNHGGIPASGKVGGSYLFSGSGKYINYSDVGLPAGSSARTFAGWFKVNNPNYAGIVEIIKYGTETPNYKSSPIGLDGRKDWLKSISWMPYGGTANAKQKITDTSWHHFVMTYSEGSFGNPTFYIDGISGTSYNDISGAMNTILNGELQIGISPTGYGGSGIYLDEIRIYNRALSPSEALSLYGFGSNNTQPPVQNATCIDSDGGLNYYTKGNINSSQTGYDEDHCLGSSNISLVENICNQNNQSDSHLYACPNGCFDGACINSTCPNIQCITDPCPGNHVPDANGCTSCASACKNQTRLTCTDSDGGLNYTVKGTTTICSPENGCSEFSDDDWCEPSNPSLLNERYCFSNNISKTQSYQCPNGCSNGACINSSYQIIPVNSDGNCVIINYSTGFGNIYGCQYNGKVYNITTFGGCGVWPTNLSISYDGKTIYALLDQTSSTNNKINLDNGVSITNYGAPCAVAYLTLHFDTQVCQSLIDSVMNPVSTDERQLSWNWTYNGNNWINGNYENYTEYGASWYWNSPADNANEVNHYNLNEQVQVYDNKNINLSELINWNQNNPACKAQSYWLNNKENTYFICNWNIFNNQQDVDNNYQSNNRQTFWYNDNVVVSMYLYWGNELTDAQVQRLTQQKVNDLINNLQNNNYEYVDWGNFEIPWPVSNELNNALSNCDSDIAQTNSRSWSCKTEPVICPEYGYQTRICRSWNEQTGEEDIQTNQMSCSPGMCSGCMTPKWLWGSDNKCVPYGFRIVQQSGRTEKIYENEIVNNIINQLGIDVTFAIKQDGTAQINVNQDINLFNASNGEVASFVFVVDGTTYNGTSGESLVVYPGIHSIDVAFYNINGDKVQSDSAQIEISHIYYSDDSSKRYLELMFRNDYPAYCDIDGNIKQQKTQAWGECQNNYECESNLCSYGECADIKGMFDQVNKFKLVLVRTMCKIVNLLNSDNYEQCVFDSTGVGGTSPSMGGSGGGSFA